MESRSQRGRSVGQSIVRERRKAKMTDSRRRRPPLLVAEITRKWGGADEAATVEKSLIGHMRVARGSKPAQSLRTPSPPAIQPRPSPPKLNQPNGNDYRETLCVW